MASRLAELPASWRFSLGERLLKFGESLVILWLAEPLDFLRRVGVNIPSPASTAPVPGELRSKERRSACMLSLHGLNRCLKGDCM